MQRKCASVSPAIALACILVLFGIGASARTHTFGRTPVTVSIYPVSAILLTGGTQQFTATVTGSSNTAVTWSATAGTVSTNGLYTAPATAGTYSVTATSQANSTKSASATVTVNTPAVVAVSISPVSAALLTGATQQLTATVTGSSNTAVTWSATGGTVSTNGLYTAPATAGTYSVTATSQANSTKSASAAVTVTTSSPLAFVQVAAATPQSPQSMVTVIYTAAQTAGNLNVVVVGWNDGTSKVTSVSDSCGNAYTLAVGPTSGTGLSQSIYYAKNIASGSNTVTVTFNQAAASPDIRILEYTGLDPVSPLDVTAAAVGNSNSASSASATTTATSELILGADTIATTTTGPGSGFTRRIITSPDSDLVEDKLVSTTGTYSATATLSSGSWVMQMATFKAASSTTPPAVAVSVSPSSANLATGGTQQFTAYVSGSSNTAVTWSATAGTVSSSGLYTAPATAGTYSVTATSQANSTKSASATVTVTTPAVAVSISPVSAELLTDGTQQFTAYVSGSSNTAVTWSATGGTVSANGLYTAPATAGTYSVTATSEADTTKSATASVTVTSSSAGSPALVQHVSSSNTRNNSFSSPYCYHYQLPNLTTAGNSVVVGFTFNSDPTPTVSDDQGNSYSLQVNYYDSADTQSIAIATAFNIVAGARVISVCFSSDPGGYVQPMATEFDNVVGIDAAAASQGSGTSATAGSMTPTVVGDLAYQVVFNMPPKQSAFTAGSQSNISWSLLSADLMDGWAAQYGLYNSTSAINPTLTMGTSQNWVSAAVLLKTGTSGSVPSGMRIVHLMHENIPVNTAAGGTGNSFANPILLQFPSSGNLLVAMIGGGLACTVTNITDTNQNAWTQAGATQTIGGNDTVQAYYAENAVSGNLGLTVQWSATDGDQTIFFYDVTGAATSPLDTTAGSSGSQSVAGNLTMPFTITPAGANEIIFEEVIWDSNTASGLVGPEQFFDSNTFDGESQSGPEPVDQNNGWGHALTTSTAPVAITWETMYSGLATGNWAGMAAAFTAAP